MEEQKLRLFPRKEFEIILEDKTIIKGRYSLWASKRYSDKLGLTLMELFEKEEKNHVTFDDIVQVVLCSVEDAFRRDKKPMPYTDQDVCDWFEWLGGIGSPDYLRLMGHAKNELGEKKSLTEQSNGTTSSESVMQVA